MQETGDTGMIPGSGRSSGGWNGNSLQYSCLENSMHRGAWWTTVHGVAKSQTQLNIHEHATHAYFSPIYSTETILGKSQMTITRTVCGLFSRLTFTELCRIWPVVDHTFGMLSVISTKTQFKLYHKKEITGSCNWDMRVSCFWNDWIWGLLRFFSLLLCYRLYSLLLPTGSSTEAGKATGDPDFLSPKSRERYLFSFCPSKAM